MSYGYISNLSTHFDDSQNESQNNISQNIHTSSHIILHHGKDEYSEDCFVNTTQISKMKYYNTKYVPQKRYTYYHNSSEIWLYQVQTNIKFKMKYCFVWFQTDILNCNNKNGADVLTTHFLSTSMSSSTSCGTEELNFINCGQPCRCDPRNPSKQFHDRTCSYLLGNAGLHCYNGNPPDR